MQACSNWRGPLPLLPPYSTLYANDRAVEAGEAAAAATVDQSYLIKSVMMFNSETIHYLRFYYDAIFLT